jgi:hypothetical protein
MADTKISGLSAAAAALTTDEIPVNQGGETKKMTVAQMLALHSVTSNDISVTNAALSNLTSAHNALSNTVSAGGGGGSGSVTSNELSAVSAAVTSVDTRVNTLSNLHSVLSQAVSVMSQAVSVNGASLSNLISAHNVLSNRVSANSSTGGSGSVTSNELSAAAADTASAFAAMSNAVSVLSQAVSVMSQAVSVMSQKVSVLSQAVSVLSQAVSVISAAVAGPVQRMISAVAAVTVSASGLTNITGLSASVAAGGSYRLDACLIHSLSSPNAFGFGLTFPAFEVAAGTLRGIVSIAAASGISLIHGAFNKNGSGSIVYSAVAGDSATNYHTFITGYFHSANADGVIQLQARTSGATVGAINIQKGSYMQLFRIA